jgi:hypothetical protein
MMEMDGQSTSQSARMDRPLRDESMLPSGGHSPMMPSPLERLRDLRTPVYSTTPSNNTQPKPSLVSHSRSASMVGASRRGNRLSLSLPVQPPHRVRHTPSSSVSATPVGSLASTPWDTGFPSPTDSNGFLVALAAQDRRVLELKDELHRAEAELEKLKRQWGLHEASKKRSEIRHTEQLRSIPAEPVGLGVTEGERHNTAKPGRDEEIKQLVRNTAKPGQRTVMAGQRHTRTLSLLDSSRYGSRPSIDLAASEDSRTNGIESNPDRIIRSTTLPELTRNPTNINEHQTETRNSLQGQPRDAILRTGRQIAEDFKDGLKTFFEDLRQATVGDEAINASSTRTASSLTAPKVAKRQGSKNSLRSNGKRSPGTSTIRSSSSRSRSRDEHQQDTSSLIDMGGSFWKDHGIEDTKVGKRSPSQTQKNDQGGSSVKSQAIDDDDDVWDAWDTPTSKVPSPRWSSSTYVSEGSPPSETFNLARNTPKDEEMVVKRDEIPWPALQKLSPGNLKRTASTLMHEWEKSLTPPAEMADEPSVS